MRHQLSCEILTTSNSRLLRVEDTSIYAVGLPRECMRLEILVPGYTEFVKIDVTPGFRLNLTSCDLGIQTVGCNDSTQDLPDGLYIIRFSCAPNDRVFVEYHHLRTTLALQDWDSAISLYKLNLRDEQSFKVAIRNMMIIRGYIYAAVAKVQESHQTEDGLELLWYAMKKIQKILKSC
jgi:hypothetical protein